MKKQERISMLIAILILTSFAATTIADSKTNSNNNTPLINETETTGAFGSNEKVTLEEKDISDKVIKEDLTDKAITEVENKFESEKINP